MFDRVGRKLENKQFFLGLATMLFSSVGPLLSLEETKLHRTINLLC